MALSRDDKNFNNAALNILNARFLVLHSLFKPEELRNWSKLYLSSPQMKKQCNQWMSQSREVLPYDENANSKDQMQKSRNEIKEKHEAIIRTISGFKVKLDEFVEQAVANNDYGLKYWVGTMVSSQVSLSESISEIDNILFELGKLTAAPSVGVLSQIKSLSDTLANIISREHDHKLDGAMQDFNAEVKGCLNEFRMLGVKIKELMTLVSNISEQIHQSYVLDKFKNVMLQAFDHPEHDANSLNEVANLVAIDARLQKIGDLALGYMALENEYNRQIKERDEYESRLQLDKRKATSRIMREVGSIGDVNLFNLTTKAALSYETGSALLREGQYQAALKSFLDGANALHSQCLFEVAKWYDKYHRAEQTVMVVYRLLQLAYVMEVSKQGKNRIFEELSSFVKHNISKLTTKVIDLPEGLKNPLTVHTVSSVCLKALILRTKSKSEPNELVFELGGANASALISILENNSSALTSDSRAFFLADMAYYFERALWLLSDKWQRLDVLTKTLSRNHPKREVDGLAGLEDIQKKMSDLSERIDDVIDKIDDAYVLARSDLSDKEEAIFVSLEKARITYLKKCGIECKSEANCSEPLQAASTLAPGQC